MDTVDAAVRDTGLPDMLAEIEDLHRTVQEEMHHAGLLRTPTQPPLDYAAGVREAVDEAQQELARVSPALTDLTKVYERLRAWSAATDARHKETLAAVQEGLTEQGVREAHARLLRAGATDVMVLHNFLLAVLQDGPLAAVRSVRSGELFAVEVARRGRGRKARDAVTVGGHRLTEESFMRRLVGDDAAATFLEYARFGLVGFALNAVNGIATAAGSTVVWVLGYAVWRTQARWRFRLVTGLAVAFVLATVIESGVPGAVLGPQSSLSQVGDWVSDMAATLPAAFASRVFDYAFGFIPTVHAALTGVHPVVGMLGTELVCYIMLTAARGKELLDLSGLLSAKTAKALLVTSALGGALGAMSAGMLGVSIGGGAAPVVAALVSVLYALLDPAYLTELLPADAVVLPEPQPYRETLVVGDKKHTVGLAISRPSPGGPVLHLARCLALAEGVQSRAFRLAGC